MIRNIIWKGLEDESLEFCRINFGKLITVKSSIVGCSDDVPFKVDYELEMSEDWIISNFNIKACLGNADHSFSLNHNGHGGWYNSGKEWKHLEGCMDIDITLTPFTNSLPINRLSPQLNQQIDIDVVYIDVLRFGITPRRQHYIQLDENTYRFSHDHDDFTADILFDDCKLVTRYPGLFERMLIKD
jgi:hypothetical protein